MEELIINDQKYVSSKKAAQITGYAKDYIGQLCREGRVEARLVGRSWYVRESALRDHRFGSTEPHHEAKHEDLELGERDPGLVESPKYEPIKESLLPEIAKEEEGREEVITEEKGIFEPVLDTASQMQAAWHEWFSKNTQEEPAEKIEIKKIKKEVVELGAHVDEIPQISDQNFESMQISENLPQEKPMDSEEVTMLEFNKTSRLGTKLALILIAVLFLCVAVLGSGKVPYVVNSQAAAAILYVSGTTYYVH